MYEPIKIHLLSRSGICTPMFTTALFTITKKWKQPKCQLTDKWIQKMCNIHTLKYYEALKMKEFLSHGLTSMTLC